MGNVVVTLDSPSSSYGSGGPTHTAGADQKRITGTLQMSTSYATGGDTLNASQVGVGSIDDLWIQPTNQSGVTLVYQGRGTNSLVKMFANVNTTTGGTPGAGTEMTTGTDAHLVVARFFAWGS